jgi:hypothetical protein
MKFPIAKTKTWISYIDYNERQIGDRESGEGIVVMSNKGIMLPKVKETREGVCSISIYDAPIAGNMLFQFWLYPNTLLEKGIQLTTPPAL